MTRSDVHDEHPGSDELAQRLEAYASARLSMSRRAATRMRAALIEEARMRSLEATMGRSGARPMRRRLVALLLAAALAIAGIAGIAAAASAGGPFYGARIWLETVTLPQDANSRAQERIHLIDTRVLEVERAIASGDANAVAAATAAYRAAIDAALGDAGTDDARLIRLRAALGVHVEVLRGLEEKIPGPAMQAIDRAIESSTKAVEKIDKVRPNGNGNPGGTNVPGATHDPGASGQRDGEGDAPAATEPSADTQRSAPESPSPDASSDQNSDH